MDGLVALEFASANLGALKVREDADGLVCTLTTSRWMPDHADEFGFLFVASMGEVETGDVEAGADEFAKDFRGVGGRAERGDDLGATDALRRSDRDNVRTWV